MQVVDKAKLKNRAPILTFRISYLGFKTEDFPLRHLPTMLIKILFLYEQTNQLDEVEVKLMRCLFSVRGEYLVYDTDSLTGTERS